MEVRAGQGRGQKGGAGSNYSSHAGMLQTPTRRVCPGRCPRGNANEASVNSDASLAKGNLVSPRLLLPLARRNLLFPPPPAPRSPSLPSLSHHARCLCLFSEGLETSVWRTGLCVAAGMSGSGANARERDTGCTGSIWEAAVVPTALFAT